ncbi:hypothetical protein [Halococcus agarilyticus]|uniref:hypothetical protein n=1 Tax=Halococcus agarilyticus TaxID=1232219 RepID=UPI00067795A0|nr:hypothetical protein [Halococcus agarilyticus]
MPELSSIIEDDRRNAAVGWALCVVLGLAAVGSAFADPLWTGFALAGIAVAVVPAIAYRDASVLPPWEAIAVVVIPVVIAFLDVPTVLGEITTALAVVALAALCVVELHVFSSVAMTPRVAAVLVVLVTMATAGLWTILQWVADVAFGTGYLTDIPGVMWDLVIATAVAVLGGPLFGLYLRVHASTGDRALDIGRRSG